MKNILSFVVAGLLALVMASGQTPKGHTPGSFKVIGMNAALPPSSIEICPHDPLIPAYPYALPKPGDAFYAARGEAEVANSISTNVVRVYARGVFVGYAKVTDVQKPF
jgi:hypothetical protein